MKHGFRAISKTTVSLPIKATSLPKSVGKDLHREMGSPSVLMIEKNPDGVFLYTYTKDGLCLGDTWHLSIDEAKEQAVSEYGNAFTDWVEVPNEIEDVIAFSKKY